MKRTTLASALLAVSMAAGCQTSGNTQLLEMENRHLGMQINALEVRLAEKEAELRQCRRQLERQDGTDAGRRPSLPSSNGLQPPRVQPGVPRTEGAEPPLQPAPRFEGPALEPPLRAPQRQENLGPASGPTRGSDGVEELPRAGHGAASRGTAAAGALAALRIDAARSGGIDADGRPGSEGLLLVVQPLDALGNAIAVAGTLSVVALDAERNYQRVARWDIPPSTLLRHYRDESHNAYLELPLAWPGRQPPAQLLEIHVRLRLFNGGEARASLAMAADAAAGRSALVGQLGAPHATAAKPAPSEPARAQNAEAIGARVRSDDGVWMSRAARGGNPLRDPLPAAPAPRGAPPPESDATPRVASEFPTAGRQSDVAASDAPAAGERGGNGQGASGVNNLPEGYRQADGSQRPRPQWRPYR
jgi:hypothetical protein